MSRYFVNFSSGKLGSILCGFVLVLLLASCLDDDDQTNQPVPVAYVSIYHASPNAPELDVLVDDRPVERLEFTDYTGYLNFYTGDRHFKINPFNATNSLVDTTVTFADGGFYSLFIVNNLSSIETLAVRDSASAPASGKAKIRFINLSPDAPSLDVAAHENGSPLFTGQSFKQPSAFIEVNAEEHAFDIKGSSTGDALVSVSDINLSAGKFYTIVARGFINPPSGNNNALSIEVVTN